MPTQNPSAHVKRGWYWNPQTGNLEAYNNGNEIFQYPYGTSYYVSKVGADTNSGLSWAKSFLTIQAALTAAASAGASLAARRGGVKIFVAPGGYAEDLTTPLNTECPFGTLQAVNPAARSSGAVWLASATATEPILTVKARGWTIDGFEFDAPATDGCIFLDGTSTNASAKYTEIANCLFSGAYAGTTDFGVDTNEASVLTVIRDSIFFGFASRAITSSSVVTEQWEIKDCLFLNSANFIAPKGGNGWAEASIHDCVFHNQGGLFTATLKIDMRGGRYNYIGPNNFLGGTYDNAGGYYASGTDSWRGNACEDGHQATNPAA